MTDGATGASPVPARPWLVPAGDAWRSISNIRNFCPAAESIEEALRINY